MWFHQVSRLSQLGPREYYLHCRSASFPRPRFHFFFLAFSVTGHHGLPILNANHTLFPHTHPRFQLVRLTALCIIQIIAWFSSFFISRMSFFFCYFSFPFFCYVFALHIDSNLLTNS